MRELLSVEEVEELVQSRYAELACVLLTRVGSCADVKAGNVRSSALRHRDYMRTGYTSLSTLYRLGLIFLLFSIQGLSPVTAAVDAFKEFLDRSKSAFVFDALEEKEAWPTLETQATNTEVGQGTWA